MATILDQRPFLPARDYARSLDFYARMGWQTLYRDENISLLEMGKARLFVQNFYERPFAENLMIHLVVDDARAWHDAATRVKQEGGFDEVRVHAPKREAYGALVTHVIDPAGVLLHFAQMDAK